MKNDNHKWDNKHPTAQMLGRWQPWHAGHQKLFEETLKKTGQVNIMIRDVQGVDDSINFLYGFQELLIRFLHEDNVFQLHS